MPAGDYDLFQHLRWPLPDYRRMDWLPPPVPTGPLPCSRPCCAPVTFTTNTTNLPAYPYQPEQPSAYSIGGGAVAPVPQGPAVAVAAAAAPKPEAPAEYATVRDAAEAALSYAAGRKPEQPRWYRLVVLPQEKPCTADTIEAAIRELNPKRSVPLDISRLSVGLIDWQRTGTLYLVEGIEVRT
jgi:hypothetical protein